MPTSPHEASPLERYGYNLTSLAQQGMFSPLSSHEGEVIRIFEILLQRASTNSFFNPVIVDIDGTTRWLIVAEVVRRMAVGEAPDPLHNQQVIALNYEALFANHLDDSIKYKGSVGLPFANEMILTELELKEMSDHLLKRPFWPPLEEWVAPVTFLQRLQEIFIALSQAKGKILLFVDPLHRLLGGEWGQYTINAAELLKPVLARRQIQLIGACTVVQYQRYIERSAFVHRRFRAVVVSDSSTYP